MKEKVIFIDDQEAVRNTFGRRLQRLFDDSVEIIALAPESTTEEMISKLLSTKHTVSYIVDENLMHSGETNYQGVELIKGIRELDSKIPIYILTSDTSLVNPLLGDIEFVIDKVDLNNTDNREDFKKRFLRNLSTYKDIKSERAKRFDELLIKSLSEPLLDDEQEEYKELNLIRSKALIDEGPVSESEAKSINERNEKLDQLEEKLKRLIDGQ